MTRISFKLSNGERRFGTVIAVNYDTICGTWLGLVKDDSGDMYEVNLLKQEQT